MKKIIVMGIAGVQTLLGGAVALQSTLSASEVLDTLPGPWGSNILLLTGLLVALQGLYAISEMVDEPSEAVIASSRMLWLSAVAGFLLVFSGVLCLAVAPSLSEPGFLRPGVMLILLGMVITLVLFSRQVGAVVSKDNGAVE